MFPIKLLTWLCSFLLLSSCSHIIQRDVLNLFYVADIKEIHGMQLKHKLLHYFNKNPNDSLYIINIDTSFTISIFVMLFIKDKATITAIVVINPYRVYINIYYFIMSNDFDVT